MDFWAQSEAKEKGSEGTNEDGSIRELSDEFGDTEATRSRTGNVESQSEGRQDKLNWEVEDVDDVLSITVCEDFVSNLHKLLHCLHKTVCSFGHGAPIE